MSESVGPRERSTAKPAIGESADPLATTRRGFLKIVVAGSTLVVGGSFLTREELFAQEGPDFVDVGDVLIAAEASYATNLTLEITPHNRVRFELPRLDKGQGIMTACAMLVADELDADYARTDVTLSDMDPDRPYSLTGYSATIREMWEPVRTICAEARARLITAAAELWEVDASTLNARKSLVFEADGEGNPVSGGKRANYGELTALAGGVLVPAVPTTPKDVSAYTLVGTPQKRKNARDIVTGKQEYTLDIDLPGAVYVVVARPPTIYGTYDFGSVDASAALAAPNVVGVVPIPQTPGPMSNALEGGVAVAARTLQEAFDARDLLSINWGSGPHDSDSDAELRAQLVAATPPLVAPGVGTVSLDATFDYPYLNHAPLEVQAAAAHVQGDTAEVWFASQAPHIAAELVAEAIGVDLNTQNVEDHVTLHVPPCGGAFGRHLFSEAATEAAIVSKGLGDVPVKLMWTRNDDMRSGRFRPMAHGALRATWLAGPPTQMATYEHNVSAAETDFRHGLGDAFSASSFDFGSTPLNQSVFEGSVTLPYNFGVKDQKLVESTAPDFQVPTCSWRSIYSGFTITSNEIFIDEIARAQGADEVQFRLDHLSDPRAIACLEWVRDNGGWGRSDLPADHGQGVAIHVEYRSAIAYLVEIDATDPNEPRLTKATVAADLGVPINPLGAQAQLQGVLIDGFSTMFRAGNHLDNGRIREGSYGDFLWARMNHAPLTTHVHIFPASEPGPGGCGELGLPPSCAASVNAYARATGYNGTPSKPAHTYEFPILEFL